MRAIWDAVHEMGGARRACAVAPQVNSWLNMASTLLYWLWQGVHV